MNDIDDKIKTAPEESLINYVAIYRSLKLNRDIAMKCMIELDERRASGYDDDYETLIDQKTKLFSSIGKGFAARVNIKSEIDLTILELKKFGIDALVLNKDQCLIHIGNPPENIREQIKNLHSIHSIEKDSKVLASVIGTKVS